MKIDRVEPSDSNPSVPDILLPAIIHCREYIKNLPSAQLDHATQLKVAGVLTETHKSLVVSTLKEAFYQYQNPQTRIESKDKPKHGTVNTILLVLNAASLEQAVEHCKKELSFSRNGE